MLVLVAFFLLFWSLNASCRTVAVFPLLDLTIGTNGTNSLLTDSVRREMVARGFEVVDEQEIMQFMILHRIRTLSRLTTHEIILAGEELGADLVLQGTVFQLQEEPPTTVSLNLQLLQTSDASLEWAHTEGLYYTELFSLLGLSDPENMDDIYRILFTRLFEDIPGKTFPAKKDDELLEIENVVLRPENVRPGEIVDCKIRLFSALQDSENIPVIVARVGDDEYPLTLDDEGYYFAASWPAQPKEGDYAVSLTGTWPSGTTRSALVGTYFVDAYEPEITITVHGKELSGKTTFNNTLYILPRLVDPEPISRWEIKVLDQKDEVIVRQGGHNEIPVRLTWAGQTDLATQAPDGDYRILFTVWDRVNLESSTETLVSLLRTPPDISIELTRDNGTVAIDLENSMATPVSYWWMKFFTETGRQFKLAEGETLPTTIEFELPEQEEGELPEQEEGREPVIEGLLYVRDVIGNQMTRKIINLFELELTDEMQEDSLEREWVEEF